MKQATAALLAIVFWGGQTLACETADLLTTWNQTGAISVLWGRPETQRDWATPDERFRIHYDVTGDNTVFHPLEDINPPDGVPDYVNRCGDYLSIAYESYVFGMGYDPPPFDGGEGGDDLYDIYLTDVTGITVPEAPSDQYPGRPAYTSFIELGCDVRSFRYPVNPLPHLRVLAAHEFFHAVQFAYRAFSSDTTAWWFESCATWAEDQVFDDVNDLYYDLEDYLVRPHRSLYLTPGQFIYGSWLLPEYLSETYGVEAIKSCWEFFASFDFAVDAIYYSLSEQGFSLNEAYSRHVVWDYFTGPNYAPGFYEEAAEFPSTVYEARVHVVYPVGWTMEPVPMQNMASSYIVFRHDNFIKGGLVIEYLNNTDARQAVCLAEVSTSGVRYDIYEIDSGVPSTFTVPNFIQLQKVVMMPVWLYEGSPQYGEIGYYYRAYLDSTITAIDDAVPIEGFAIISSYPNPFNNSVSISFMSPVGGACELSVFDIAGRRIDRRGIEAQAGGNLVSWTAPDGLASGVLYYILQSGSGKAVGKMSLLK